MNTTGILSSINKLLKNNFGPSFKWIADLIRVNKKTRLFTINAIMIYASPRYIHFMLGQKEIMADRLSPNGTSTKLLLEKMEK